MPRLCPASDLGVRWAEANVHLRAEFMESIAYFSRNGRKAPHEVTIRLDGRIVYINCNCPLGLQKKICRHKINAIRADKVKSHPSTSEEDIERLRLLFGVNSTLRHHLEEKWRLLREYAFDNPENEEEVEDKRRILGETFANGFLNENMNQAYKPFDTAEWEDSREIIADGLKCSVTLKYMSHDGVATTRDVLIDEIFASNLHYYVIGYCNLRKQKRTFRADRIQDIIFGSECTKTEKSIILDVLFQENPSSMQ